MTPRQLVAILALIAATTPAAAHLAEAAAAWAPDDIRVSQTEPGQPASASSRFEVAANGDARIAVDLRDGGKHTTGTILLVAGRWMLTQGFTPKGGGEVESLDIAALNSQLVIVLLTAVLPAGRPAPGPAQQVRLAEKSKPIRIATASTSAEYLAPWTVAGSVSVPDADAPAAYQLSFTYSDRGVARTIDLAGSVGNAKLPLELPDSMKLAGWKARKLTSTHESSPVGAEPDAGARQPFPKAATLGELRLRQ
jgi:hypothetical protein